MVKFLLIVGAIIFTLKLCTKKTRDLETDDVSQLGKIETVGGDVVRVDRVNRKTQKPFGIDRRIFVKAKRSTVFLVTVVKSGGVYASKQMGVRICSGALVEGRAIGDLPRVLTNQHCFAETFLGKHTEELIPEACRETRVYFDFSTAKNPLKRTCKKGSLVTNFNADLATFTLNADVPSKSYRPFEIWEGDVPTNRKAFVVHHPQMKERIGTVLLRELEVNLPRKAITYNCVVTGMHPREAWHTAIYMPYVIKHTCNIYSGSSGSGLVDVETGRLLGINQAGITLSVRGRGTVGKYNVAATAKYLNEFINTDWIHPVVVEETKSKSKTSFWVYFLLFLALSWIYRSIKI